jgi:two-component system response regulator NreC
VRRADGVDGAVMSIRVFIADDHGILRGGLRALINAEPDMEVVGEAASGPGAESGVTETAPDVVLMDVSMPGGGGLPAIAAIKRVRPRTRILVLTVHDELGYVRAAADAGAIGYVVKSAVDSELLAAIRGVAQGRTFMDVPGGLGLAQHSMLGRRPAAASDREAMQLSEREREVTARVAAGYTNLQIAQELRLGIKSVETYRARVMEKLGLRNRSDLVRFALECGILAPGKSA